jgi:GH15 family glucan-1,4-alpha-glucosidase
VDTIAQWERRLAPLPFHCPDRELTDSARANLAYILLNRDGPAIQPGSRAYEAAWMRDGALTSAALLRYGYPDEVRQFLSWYLSKQYPDGRVPAIVIIGRNEIIR